MESFTSSQQWQSFFLWFIDRVGWDAMFLFIVIQSHNIALVPAYQCLKIINVGDRVALWNESRAVTLSRQREKDIKERKAPASSDLWAQFMMNFARRVCEIVA